MKINHVAQQQTETALKDTITKTFTEVKKVVDKLQLVEDNKDTIDLRLYASSYINHFRKIQVILGETPLALAFARYLETSMETEMYERLYAMESRYAKKQTN